MLLLCLAYHHFLEAGYSLSPNIEAGYSVSPNIEAGYSVSPNIEAGYSVSPNIKAGYSVSPNIEAWRMSFVYAVANVWQFEHKVPNEATDWCLVTETLYIRTVGLK